MKKFAVFFCLNLLFATSAFATHFPNTMGMYWDLDADVPCIAPVVGPANLYLILTNPTMDAIDGFECGYTMEASVIPFILSALFANPQALWMGGFQNMQITFGTPTICTEATLLVTFSIGNFAGVPVDFYLHECSPSSLPGNLPVLFLTDDTLLMVEAPWGGELTAQQSTECWTWPSTDDSTWDSVKSMYR